MVIDLWWEHDESLDYLVLHAGQLGKTELAILRRSNKGTRYFLEIELPNYDLVDIPLGSHTSAPFEEQKRRAEEWVREWLRLAMSPRYL